MNNKPIRRFLRYALSTSLLLALIAGAVTVYAAFPGANGKIAFDSDRDGNQEIYAMNADGSGQTNLTNNAAYDIYPAWSPDGTKITFSTNRDGNFEIYVMNADGTGLTNITNDPGQDDTSSWSPDGTKIAFSSSRDGDREIYVMNADGTDQTRLTNNSAFDDGAVWSPDGTKIAFQTDRDGGCCPNPQDHEIYVMNAADGSGQTNITNNSEPDGAPDWSPDGTKITFNKRVGLNHEVYVMDADGTDQTNLTNSPANEGGSVWSPDGTKIAFSSSRDGNSQIYVMNADGSSQTNVSNNSFSDEHPDWQPLPDTTAPVVNVSFPIPNGLNGWFVTSPVIGSVTADDTTTGGSNITAINCTGATVGSITSLGAPSASASLTVSGEGVNNVNCTATDSAGNSGAGPGSSHTATVQIDSFPPSISIISPANGGTYLLNAAAASSYSCSDETSSVATCSGPVASGANFSTSPVGAHAFTVNATDVAGNPARATNDYDVIYNFNGFFQPVDNLPTLNLVKAGQAIPVKYSLNGDQGLNIFAAGYPRSQIIQCDSTAVVDGIEETLTAGSSSLSYNPSTDTYTYVWKTDKAWANTCRQLVLKLNDGTYHRANFKFK